MFISQFLSFVSSESTTTNHVKENPPNSARYMVMTHGINSQQFEPMSQDGKI